MTASLLACQPGFLVLDHLDDGLLITGSIRSFRELYGRFPDNPVINRCAAFLGGRHPYLFEGVWDAGSAWQTEEAIPIRKLSIDEVEATAGEAASPASLYRGEIRGQQGCHA